VGNSTVLERAAGRSTEKVDAASWRIVEEARTSRLANFELRLFSTMAW
jgi:hypothetical protein